MKRQILALLCGAAVVGAATLAGAAGFRVSEQSAKATAMANAFAAQADDPSARTSRATGTLVTGHRDRPTASTTLGAPASIAGRTAARTAGPIARKAPASGGRPVSRLAMRRCSPPVSRRARDS